MATPPTPMECPEVVPSPDAEPHVHTVFASSTQTWQWIVADPETRSAIIINPVLDQAPRYQGISTTAADRLLDIVRRHDYRVVRILETHAQRKCQTAAWYLRTQLRDPDGNVPRISTGKSIAGLRRMFARQYKVADASWNRHFDSGFEDGQIFNFGHVQCRVVQLDGNVFVFVIGRNVFLGEVPEESLRTRLAAFNIGYCWHPTDGDSLRSPITPATPSTTWNSSQTSLSGESIVQPFSPLTPNTNPKRMGLRPPSTVHEMAG